MRSEAECVRGEAGEDEHGAELSALCAVGLSGSGREWTSGAAVRTAHGRCTDAIKSMATDKGSINPQCAAQSPAELF